MGRAVHLRSAPSPDGLYDYVWGVEDIAPREVVTGSQTGVTDDGHPLSAMPMALMAPGTYQDVAPITIMTTAALAAMARCHPEGRWEQPPIPQQPAPRRPRGGDRGERVAGPPPHRRHRRVRGHGAGPRCVMTTLPQGDLPRDRDILRTVARENRQEFAGLGRWACLGVYATVTQPGEVAVGDEVDLH